MSTSTGIKHVYQGVQGACPRQAVTGTGGTAERSECRAVGAGLKLVYILKDYGLMADKFAFYLTKQFTRSSPTHPPPAPSFHKPPQNSSLLFCKFLDSIFIIMQSLQQFLDTINFHFFLLNCF